MRKYFLIFNLVLLETFSYSQLQAPSWTFNSPIYGNVIYEARDFIEFDPGSSYTAAQDQTLIARINPYLLFPPTGGETGGPNAGDNGVVGTLIGSLSVSLSGAATYTLPLEIPNGISGMQPNLSLIYNSQSGNGMLGVGWSLGGISQIGRTTTDFYRDGDLGVHGIHFNQYDQFNLDGQRLIDINSTTYGSDGAEYRTEVQSFSKIISYGTAGNGPQWFEVWTKDGKIIEYGSTEDSRIKASGRADILVWLISKVTDRQGNYISYEYEISDDMTYKPKTINYTGNNSIYVNPHIIPFYSIEFEYEPRPDPITDYLSGSYINTNLRLSKIDIKYIPTGFIYKKYILTYTNDINTQIDNINKFYSHLKKIEVHDGSGNHLNPITFNWGNPPDNKYETINDALEAGSYDILTGDFNGDGKTDILKLYNHYEQYGENQPPIKIFTSWQLFLATVDINGITGFDYHQSGVLGDGCTGVFAGDFNGDGLSDLIQVYTTWWEYHPTSILSVSLAQVHYYGFSGFAPWYNITGLHLDADYIVSDLQTGDFNGDGLDDVAVRFNYKTINGQYDDGYNCQVLLSIININGDPTNNVSMVGVINDIPNINRFIVGNFYDKTRKDLLILAGESYSAIYYWDASVQYFVKSTPTFGYPTKYHIIFTGDFNGDGITDVLTCAPPTYYWELTEFTGGGEIWPATQLSFLPSFNPIPVEGNYNVFVSDFNGDGKSDIMLIDATNQQVKFFFSKGNSEFIEQPEITDLDVVFVSNPHFAYSDFNGDGKADILYTKDIYTPRILLLSHPNDETELIKSVLNGFGKQDKITYTPLTTIDYQIYKKYNLTYSQSLCQVKDFQGPLFIVNKIESENGIGNFLSTSYGYEGSHFIRLNNDFLGFTKIITQDNTTNVTTENTYYYLVQDEENSSSFYFPHLEKSQTYYNQTLINQTDNIFKASQFYPNYIPIELTRVFFPYISISNIKIWEIDGSIYKKTNRTNYTYTYPNILYGNPTSITILNDPQQLDKDALDYQFTYKESHSFTYFAYDEANWIISNLKSNTTQTSIVNKGSQIKNSSYFYYPIGDARSQLLQQEIIESENNDPLERITVFDYFPFGNLKSKLLQAPNSNPPIANRLTTYEYDPTYGRFLTKTTNALNHSESFTYNPLTGFQTSHSDLNNQTTTYSSDIFGTNIHSNAPDGKKSAKVLRWVNGQQDAPTNALFYSWEQTTGSSEVYTYFDKLGRNLRKVTKGFNGTSIFVDQQYDGSGRPTKTSQPYYSNSSPNFVEKKYNSSLARVDYLLYPDNTHLWYAYNGLTTSTTNEAGQTSTQKVNAIGLLEEGANSNSNAVKYDYSFSNNDLITKYSVDGHQETESIIQTDKFGNRTVLIDPSFGTVHDSYNAFGELISHKSQKQDDQNQTKFTYDQLGRMVSRTEDQEITTWSYDAKPHGIGELDKVYNNSNSIEFFYDELSRIIKKTETIVGESESFSYQYKYDPYSRLKQQIYPTGILLNNYYYPNGYLRKISEGDHDELILWETLAQDANDKLLQGRLGNNITSSMSYDPYTERLSSIFSTAKSISLQDLEYQWDEIGNLLSRKKWTDQNHLSSLDESFQYDNLNRLTSSNLNQQLITNFDYDNLGNFLNKPPLSNITYGAQNSGPYAIIAANFNSDEISSTPQNITYTIFDKINSIFEGSYTLEMIYGVNHNRIRQVINKDGDLFSKKIYIGDLCEKITDNQGERFINYIIGPFGLCSIITKKDGIDHVNFILNDHLGSLNCILDQSGNLLEELSFDAWGRRRNPYDWTFNNVPTAFQYDRGFTGHEHLDIFGLINMNGRVYDPIVGRFLSTDNFIEGNNSQNLNRYSYCLNNPLKYTDPDGEWAINVAIGAVIGGLAGWQIGENAGAKGWDMVGYIIGGAVIGAATSGIGVAVASSAGVIVGGVVGGAVGGAGFGTLGGYAAGLRDSKLIYAGFTGMLQGAVTGLVGSCVGGAIRGGWGAFAGGAIAGGFGTWICGGSGEDILKGAALGGVMGWGAYHASLAYSYYASGIKSTGLTYNRYAKMIAITERSIFSNREGKFILGSRGNIIANKLEGINEVGVNILDYKDAFFDYHTHQDWGSTLADGEGFSTYTSGKLESDEYTRSQLNLIANFKDPMYLGTREGHIWYLNSDFSRGMLPYNFSSVFTPFNIAWSLSLIR